MPEQYFNERQFAAQYRISCRTAQRWRVTGDGPPFVRIGLRKIAYRLSDCEAWAAAGTFRSLDQESAKASTSTADAGRVRIGGFAPSLAPADPDKTR